MTWLCSWSPPVFWWGAVIVYLCPMMTGAWTGKIKRWGGHGSWRWLYGCCWDLTWGFWPEHMIKDLSACGNQISHISWGSKDERPNNKIKGGSCVAFLSWPQNSCSHFSCMLLVISKSETHVGSKDGYVDIPLLMGWVSENLCAYLKPPQRSLKYPSWWGAFTHLKIWGEKWEVTMTSRRRQPPTGSAFICSLLLFLLLLLFSL